MFENVIVAVVAFVGYKLLTKRRGDSEGVGTTPPEGVNAATYGDQAAAEQRAQDTGPTPTTPGITVQQGYRIGMTTPGGRQTTRGTVVPASAGSILGALAGGTPASPKQPFGDAGTPHVKK
jgi:hypothetical protein